MYYFLIIFSLTMISAIIISLFFKYERKEYSRIQTFKINLVIYSHEILFVLCIYTFLNVAFFGNFYNEFCVYLLTSLMGLFGYLLYIFNILLSIYTKSGADGFVSFEKCKNGKYKYKNRNKESKTSYYVSSIEDDVLFNGKLFKFIFINAIITSEDKDNDFVFDTENKSDVTLKIRKFPLSICKFIHERFCMYM